MRTRRTLLLALVVILALLPLSVAPVIAAAGQAVLAQTEEPGDPVGEEEAPLPGEEMGEGDPETETDPGGGEEAGATEEGPVWTYQMARIGLGLLVLLLAGVAFTYRAFVASRHKVGG